MLDLSYRTATGLQKKQGPSVTVEGGMKRAMTVR